jgi:hypothetical protein
MSLFPSQLLVSGYSFECFQNGDNIKTDIWQNFLVFSLLNGFQWLECHFKICLKTENFKVKTPHRYKLWYSKTYTE